MVMPVTIKSIFDKLDKKYTKAGVLLKGLRLREDLSQVEFARKINVTQANLSNMEHGRRSIGKIIAPDFSIFQWLFNFKFILSSSWIKLCSAVRSDPEEREARLEG
ncbi:MAG: hypothetical protein A3F42_04750 [Gammaproteobacteria bacterium RIFCSPHIGHO2_12_FULL_37_34]|nr:MAG: hypothetical protein A3F42_04750 [Gammaproteobacteria bacterium RIFCSPHIGHO2_12_FULL_37_34]